MHLYTYFSFLGIALFYILSAWRPVNFAIHKNILLKILYIALGVLSFIGLLFSLGNIWLAGIAILIVLIAFYKVLYD